MQTPWEWAANHSFADCDVAACIESLRADFRGPWCPGTAGNFTEDHQIPVDRFLRTLHACAQEHPQLELQVCRITVKSPSLGKVDVIAIHGMTLRQNVLPAHKNKSAEIKLPRDLQLCLPPVWLELFTTNFGIDRQWFLKKLTRA